MFTVIALVCSTGTPVCYTAPWQYPDIRMTVSSSASERDVCAMVVSDLMDYLAEYGLTITKAACAFDL